MEWVGPLVVAGVIAAIIILVARRWRGDRPGDRGPFSSAMEARSGFAAFGTTPDSPPGQDAESRGADDRRGP